MKFAGINPACACVSGKKPRVAPGSSDLSSQWQNMTVDMVNKVKT
nr:MAG TPA: hypothetical protein [Caudoviricetes sp.]